MKGKLIIIESGSDASGKATQTKRLFERLSEENSNIRKVEYPNYDSESSALVKMYLRGEFGEKATDVDPYIASTFFSVDRYASFKTEWEEFYNNGGIVLADRYTTSNMVHQASKMDEDERDKYLDWLVDYEFNLYKRLIFDIIIPITIYKAPHIKIPIKLLGPKEVKKLEISFPEASPAPTIVPMNTTATWNILSNSFFN